MKQRLTPFGREVKKKLIDRNMTQAEFCKEHGIPRPRFSEMITGSQPLYKYKKLVSEVLGIEMDIA